MPNVVFKTYYYKPSTDRELKDPNFKDKVKKRNYYSSNSRNDYIQYILNGAKQDKGYDYVQYVGDGHEKTSGLFDRKGLISKERKKQIREQLRVTKSVIWDALISFDKEFSEGKIENYQDCILVLNHVLPKFLKENGLSEENVCFFAGLHQNTEHPHIHMCFFELEPKHKRANKEGLFFHNGDITQISIDNVKIRTEEYLSGNQYFIDSYRNHLVDGTIDALKLLQGKNRIEKRIKEKLSELYYVMPKGKISYNSLEFAPYRDLVDEIGEMLIDSNPVLKETYFALKKSLRKKDEDISAICKSQHVDASRYLLEQKYIDDFKKRIGNQVIQYAKKYEFSEKYENKSKEQQAKIRWKQKRYRQNLLRSTMNLNRMVEDEADMIFIEYQNLIRRAERIRLEVDGGIEAE